MDVQRLEPAAAADAPVPLNPLLPAAHASGLARVVDLVEGVLFYGIVGFGLTFPILAAVYALLRR